MKQLLTFIFSLSLLLTAHAQEITPADSTAVADTTSMAEATESDLEDASSDEKAFSFGVYGDYGKLLTYWTAFEQKLEFGAFIKYRMIGIGAEYGRMDLNPNRPFKNGDVNSEGSYSGFYLQLYAPIDEMNRLYAGVGYHQGEFSEEQSFLLESDLWGSYEETISQEGITASWVSIRLGSEKKLNSFISIGGVLEFRILSELDESYSLMPHVIPGYGNAEATTIPALNFYLLLGL